MAKLKGPLFSLGARGKIANTLVYFPWKGIKAVREYVIPANPKTADQLTQRGRMTSAVAEFHAAAYSALDLTAFNRWANVLAGSLSGFNAMVRSFINEAILGNTWERIGNVTFTGIAAAQVEIHCLKAAAGNAPTVRYGVSKTNMPNTATMDDGGGGVWDDTIAGLNADTLYYFTIDVGATGVDFGRTGIYAQRTAA